MKISDLIAEQILLKRREQLERNASIRDLDGKKKCGLSLKFGSGISDDVIRFYKEKQEKEQGS